MQLWRWHAWATRCTHTRPLDDRRCVQRLAWERTSPRRGEGPRATAVRRLSAFEEVPEPVRVHDPWNVEVEIDAGVAKALPRVAELGDVEPHAASGDAVEELARYTASVDLLVLGPHQHRPKDQLMGGSTSPRLS